MNFMKRAFFSVQKKAGISLILFCIFSVIGITVLSGLSIQSASNKAKNHAKRTIGGVVRLKFDMTKLVPDANGVTVGEAVHPEAAKRLSKLPYVKGYNFTHEMYAKSIGFHAISGKSAKMNGLDLNKGIAAMYKRDGKIMPDIFVIGICDTRLVDSFQSGICKLIKGRQITETDENKDVIIIEKSIAERNQIKLHDKITIQSVYSEKTKSLEVVGIYENHETAEGIAVWYDQYNPVNRMFVPWKVNVELTGDAGVQDVDYYLDDASHMGSFIQNASTSGFVDMKKYSIEKKDNRYEDTVKPLENVSRLVNVMMILIILFGCVIVLLIAMIVIKSRTHEIGILLALGERKKAIVGQHLTELMILAILAVFLSTGVSVLAANGIGNSLLGREVQSIHNKALQADSANHSTSLVFGSSYHAKMIDRVDVSVNTGKIMIMAGTLFGMILVASIFLGIVIVRYQPKKMMIKTE